MAKIGSYEEFTKNLQEAGFKTTKINENRNEAGFDDYGFALSDDLQNLITSSFDNEQDYVLQAEVASIFKNSNTNYIDRKDFMAALRKMGYQVEWSSMKSSYLPDHKAHNRMGKYDLQTASIGVYTISDGKGGQIVIADANGNGALEIEEVFMNQILSDIALDVDQIKANFKEGASVKGMGGSSSDMTNAFEEMKEEAEEIAQDKFNSEVEKYLSNGDTLEHAEAQAASSLNAVGYSYTGSKKEKVKEEEQTVSQKDFNKKVEKNVDEKAEIEDVEASEQEAKDELKADDLSYTGDIQGKIKKRREEEFALI